jgi:imidazolonepropionase-like amidohydrolase
MQRAGMTAAAALRSATQEAARLLGVDERLGTIEEGKTADLVVVAGDPLDFDGWAGRIEQVWLDGARRV